MSIQAVCSVKYNITVKFPDGCTKSLLAELPVEVTVPLTPVEVMEGEDATFVCELSKPDQPVTWTVAGKKIKPSSKYVIESDGCTHKLTIKSCQLADKAEVTIAGPDCKSGAPLTVKGKIHRSLYSGPLRSAEKVLVQCAGRIYSTFCTALGSVLF